MIKKSVLYLLLTVLSFFTMAQQSPIVLTSKIVGNWNAYVHLPSDYTTTTKTFPTIFFFPGTGEVGSNVALVINNGPGAYITQGWNGNITTSGGTLVEFIVISLQPSAIYPQEYQIDTFVQQLKKIYRIDPKNMFFTGLSEGGWCSNTYVTGDPLGGPYYYASQVKAVWSVEGVKPDDNSPYPTLFQNYAKVGGKDALFEQTNDARNGDAVAATMNASVPGSAEFVQTAFGSTGHCCWSNFYGGQGTQPGVLNFFGVQETGYQWFASLVVPTVVSPIPVITSATTATGTNGSGFSYTITATNSPTAFTATGLPSGLSLNTSTGIISGTPTTSAAFTVAIGATNSGGTGTTNLAITINPAPATVLETIKLMSDGTYQKSTP